MPATTNFAIPYPAASDTVDVPRDIQAVADKLETTLDPLRYQYSHRNRVINGAMTVDQRNAGAIVTGRTADYFCVDRFVCSVNASGSFSGQQITNSSLAGSQLPEFTNSLGLTVTTAKVSSTASDVYGIRHRIEGYNVAQLGWGTASARPIVLSFWVRSSVTGTYSVGFFNAAANRSYVANYTISSASTWEYKTITLAGDTTGTWARDNSVGIEIFWDLGSGSTYQTTAGSWAAGVFVRSSTATRWISNAGATFYMTGVQLEVGTTATQFEHRPFPVELAMCQRYFVQFSNSGQFYGVGMVYPTNNAYVVVALPVTMRVAPTSITTTGSFIGLDSGGVGRGFSTVAFSSGTVNALGLNCTGGFNFTNGAAVLFFSSGATSIAVNGAEL